MSKIFRASFLLPLLILCLSTEAGAKVYVAEPLLVAQPSYAGMQFYVYQPYNMPKGWYVTLDGYPVWKNSDGVWVYGTSNGPNLTPTNYIVGSVVPSMAGIVPWMRPAQVSELRRQPAPGSAGMGQGGMVVQGTPPASTLARGQNYSTWIPDWTYNPRFMALGNWKNSVDRVGVLHTPAIPVAWKGNNPKVLYAWTGASWYQITPREGEGPVRALKRELYNLVRMTRRVTWYDEDMPVLAEQCTAWGYYWMGEVVLPK